MFYENYYTGIFMTEMIQFLNSPTFAQMSGWSSKWPHGLATECSIISATLLVGFWYSEIKAFGSWNTHCFEILHFLMLLSSFEEPIHN